MTSFDTYVVIGVSRLPLGDPNTPQSRGLIRQAYPSQGYDLLAYHSAVSADRHGIFIERSSCVLRLQVLIHPVSIAAFLLFVAVIARVWRLYRS